MKQVTRNGETITIFDDIEEMKWHYHARLCKNSSDGVAKVMVEILDVAEANQRLKGFGEPCEVKECH